MSTLSKSALAVSILRSGLAAAGFSESDVRDALKTSAEENAGNECSGEVKRICSSVADALPSGGDDEDKISAFRANLVSILSATSFEFPPRFVDEAIEVYKDFMASNEI